MKTHLFCPRQKVFRGELLMNQSMVPNKKDFGPSTETTPVEVEILEVRGEQALVLLPSFMATEENDTALVEVQFLA